MRFLMCLLLVFLSGCAGAGIQPPKNASARIIDNVPFYPQEDYQCGPASLAAAMNYRGALVTPADVANDIYSKSAKGTLWIDMVLYAQSKGLDAVWYSGGLEDLRRNVDAGNPVIVLVDKGVSVFQVNHFMVVIGYAEDYVIVNSGRRERLRISVEDFMRTWEKTKFGTLLIKKMTGNK